ncbi:MAG: hypothetical protein COV48_02910 [Elusimicrobia bacterium CG11_big_fil_rev_8_21_14_0_20_64_6]|nr:MAG: hypothetical protein COV48_02910 [Elusimicrobia bacterium CG11_big_fil_rev_8_21_14_0_20_64_6]
MNSARLVDIANQSVALLDLKSRATIKETRTAEDGRFWLKNVSPGKYFIQAPGFLSLIVIKSSETLQQNIFLPATYSE